MIEIYNSIVAGGADHFTFWGFVFGVVSLAIAIYTLNTAKKIRVMQANYILNDAEFVNADIKTLETIRKEYTWESDYISSIRTIIDTYIPLVSSDERKTLKKSKERIDGCNYCLLDDKEKCREEIATVLAMLRRYACCARQVKQDGKNNND